MSEFSDVVSIPEPSCSSEELYEYMLSHAKLHSMSVLKMVLPVEAESAQVRPRCNGNCRLDSGVVGKIIKQLTLATHLM